MVGLVLAACGGGAAPTPAASRTPTVTPSPWPEGFISELCYAIDQIQDSSGHLADAVEAGSAFDFEGVEEEAAQAAQDAKEASDMIDLMTPWPPAKSVLVYLRSSADFARKGANLLKLSAQSLDATLVQEAGVMIDKATYQATRANTALGPLVDKYGPLC